MVRIDRRTSNMTPTEHHFVEMTLQTYPAAIGTTHPYSFVKLDARYLNVSGDGRSILALQGVTRMTVGRPPFQELSPLGGDLIGRGYYDGRYRDQNAAQVQAEWRRHVAGFFGITVFASAGRVWDRFDELSADYIRPAGGAGLRFNLNKDDPTNLRLDFGISHGGTGFYVQFGEAF